MAKGEYLLQSGTKQIVLAVVAWLAHGRPPDSESRRRRNHEPPKSGIPKRKKTATHNRLSCKIEYLLRSNHGNGSIASEFFTGDELRALPRAVFGPVLVCALARLACIFRGLVMRLVYLLSVPQSILVRQLRIWASRDLE